MSKKKLEQCMNEAGVIKPYDYQNNIEVIHVSKDLEICEVSGHPLGLPEPHHGWVLFFNTENELNTYAETMELDAYQFSSHALQPRWVRLGEQHEKHSYERNGLRYRNGIFFFAGDWDYCEALRTLRSK